MGDDEPALSDVVVVHQQAELQQAFEAHSPTSFYNVLPHTDNGVRLIFYNGFTNAIVYNNTFEVTLIPEGLVDESGMVLLLTWYGEDYPMVRETLVQLRITVI